jgi:Nif-specific regulatory protein
MDASVLEWSTVPERNNRSSVLLAVGDLLQREVDLDVLLRQIVDRIVAAVDADRGTLYLVDARRGELYSKAGHLPELREIRLKLGQGLAGVVAESGQLLNLPAVAEDRRFFKKVDAQTGYRTRSMMVAPVRARGGEIIGVLQVLNAKQGRFTDDDEQRLRRLCAEAATAIESTSLYAELSPGRGDKGAAPLSERYRYNRIVGESGAMRAVYELLRKAAATSASVLLRGESGTGKELIARAIHVNSTRARGPFIKLDCTTIPATLMENELFGHEKGAFTGADSRAIGRCEAADGGTLFIDEIGELPLALQAKLLRFLQDREFERVGGSRTQSADVRVVAATHRDLEEMVGRGEFREDLYYRIKVVQIALPALRERGPGDITRLAAHFLALYKKKHGKPELVLGDAAEARLCAHHWPGNIRELEHCIESAVVLCDGGTIGPTQLSLPGERVSRTMATVSALSSAEAVPRALAEVEREHIVATFKMFGGNRSEAARSLGIGRNTLLRKLKAYGVE